MNDEALTVSERFRDVARARPDAPALAYGTTTLSYGGLDAQSDRLAARLIRAGIAPDDRVGVVIEDRPKAVISMLAAMKCGAAYVPLDLGYPPARLLELVREAGLGAIVAPRDALERAESLGRAGGAPIVVIDDDAALADAAPVAPMPKVHPDTLAYVIYTSGSTGQPKGVMISHRSVMRLFHETAPSFEFSEDDAWPLLHTIAFDFSVWEIWGALLYGGLLAIPAERDIRDPAALCDFIASANITVLNQTPSSFYRLCAYLEQYPDAFRRLATLKLIIFGGERLDFRQLARWYALAGPAGPVVVNMYGITETTVHVTLHPVDPDTELEASESLIGDPIPDLRMYILDEHGAPVPPGVVGELFVSGPGLARGYHARADLTADAFVPCPFAGRPGERMYRTGDLARYLPDGRVAYVSRKNGYLKLRGFRVSLGEIESTLRACDGVQDAYVSARAVDGVDVLDAYVMPDGRATLTIADLRAQFGRRLPGFCMPQHFYVIDSVALTRNGKVDFDTMRARSVALSARRDTAMSDNEAALLSIWRTVLGSPHASIDTDFFEAGGDSIRAVDLALAMARAGWRVGVQDIFVHGNVANLAAACKRADPPAAAPAARGSASASDMQTIMLNAYDENLAHRNGVYHVVQSFDVHDPHAEIDVDALRRCLVETLSEQPVFSAVFARRDGGIVRTRASRPRLAVTVSPAGHARPATGAGGQAVTVINPFDAESPLLYASLTRVSPRRARVTLETHHAVDDGWGQQRLLADALDRYGQPPRPTTSRPDPFDAYVLAQQDMSRSTRARAFWADYAINPGFLRAPGRRAARIGETDGAIDARTVDALYRLCQGLRVQTKAAFFVAACRAIAALEGDRHVTFGAVTNGRTADIDGSLESAGLYWNILPFSMRVDPAAEVEQDLVDVHRELNTVADFSLYPLSRILHAHGGRDFRYSMNFTNFDGVQRPGRLESSNWEGQDRFHYPVNLAIGVDRSDGVNHIRIVADDDVLSRDGRSRLIGYLLDELERIARRTTAAATACPG
ncbi:non-ribosomal peptide synthetase [Burkholderia ubonensis]|uniref:Carrier domain-containing protein n=1 Tax=Burkholderia ubonensis subsp. mesacidophila TaxID=265293 RepID=A0A2A4FC36_9BURK|nr:non-ribosomal peptide synthetase [Burkholderia ubonensis]PCE30154.1 hypothetical protein BZL54_22135 [Burkholderia ubonensis subsp. mesacidophila]